MLWQQHFNLIVSDFILHVRKLGPKTSQEEEEVVQQENEGGLEPSTDGTLTAIHNLSLS
jgi:hypothetical protein